MLKPEGQAMRRHTGAVLTVSALVLGLALGGCESTSDIADKLQDLIPFGTGKKPLPGERKPVFPEGVPGVPQGVPPELVKGYQAEPETAVTPQSGAPGGQSKEAKAAEPEKPKPKPKKTAAKPPAQPSRNQANQGA